MNGNVRTKPSRAQEHAHVLNGLKLRDKIDLAMDGASGLAVQLELMRDDYHVRRALAMYGNLLRTTQSRFIAVENNAMVLGALLGNPSVTGENMRKIHLKLATLDGSH